MPFAVWCVDSEQGELCYRIKLFNVKELAVEAMIENVLDQLTSILDCDYTEVPKHPKYAILQKQERLFVMTWERKNRWIRTWIEQFNDGDELEFDWNNNEFVVSFFDIATLDE